jgi:hypothetical protein
MPGFVGIKTKPETRTYWCNRCEKLVERASETGFFPKRRRSFCVEAGKDSKLYLRKTEKRLARG